MSTIKMTQHFETTDDNIGARTRTAAGWQLLSRGINTTLKMATSIVLARLLMPDDFGIIAMATMVTGLGVVFRDLGLGQALVQRDVISDRHIRAAFWGTLTMAVLLYAAIYFSAPWVSSLFHEPRMIPVIRVIGFVFLLSPLAVVPRSLLQRGLDFRTQFFAGLASSLAYGAVGITMALLGYGYWALVWASLAGGAANTLSMCILTRYVPPAIPSFDGVHDLLDFGIGVTGVAIGHYIASQIDYFMIGRRLDADALGLYTRAYAFVTYPAVLAGTVSPVFFPAFSRMQNDHDRMRSAYGRLTALMSTVFFPLLAIAVISAPELIPTVFGEQWTPAVLPSQILIVIGLCKIAASGADAVIKAAGRVYAEAWIQMLYGVLIGVGAWFAAPHGIVAVAIAVACANVIHYTLIGHLVWSAIGFGIMDYGTAFRGPILTTLATATVGLLCRWAAISSDYTPLSTLLLTIGPAALVAYVLTVKLRLPEMKEAVAEINTFSRRGLSLVRRLGSGW